MTTIAPAAAAKKAPGLLRSSAIYSALTLVSRFLGLARDLVITAKLGASGNIAADAYYTALTFPNLFRRMFAEGAFASAFVPDYSKRLASDGKYELAASLLESSGSRFEYSTSVANAKRLVYLKLMEKHQNTDPFKFIIYSAKIGEQTPQMTSGK